jgi:hypothetical protein
MNDFRHFDIHLPKENKILKKQKNAVFLELK